MNKTIVCLGDSITFGYLNSKSSWVSILNDNFRDTTFINKGINGDTTTGMLNRLREDVLNYNPDTIIFMGGINDIALNIDLETMKSNIIEICNTSKENKIELIILTLLPAHILNIEIGERFNDTFNEYNKWLISYANENSIKYIDTYSIMTNILKTENDIYSDGLHLTKTGNKILANELKDILIKEGII